MLELAYLHVQVLSIGCWVVGLCLHKLLTQQLQGTPTGAAFNVHSLCHHEWYCLSILRCIVTFPTMHCNFSLHFNIMHCICIRSFCSLVWKKYPYQTDLFLGYTFVQLSRHCRFTKKNMSKLLTNSTIEQGEQLRNDWACLVKWFNQWSTTAEWSI